MANLTHTLLSRPLRLSISQNSAKLRRISTLPQNSPLEQKITYSLKEFLLEYEKRSKVNQENMEKSLKENQESMKENIKNIVEQRVSSAENKFLYLMIIVMTAGLTKVWYDQYQHTK
ncbi:8480_t:CDS:2 [Diversispora eburnea]|uniref:8480_t:CDS:1 n=1 Tax=Diversispora eburnea TaxID=1213867 RepID=A0A9N9FCJ5_9GLOM|nr:8480_t:CDS:2 [Diversispora eburnea]